MDHSPSWLRKSFPSPPPWHNEPVEHEVDLSDLSQQVLPKEIHWTLSDLQTMKDSLLRQINEELSKQDEIENLREECANLAHGLEWLRSHRSKTVGFP